MSLGVAAKAPWLAMNGAVLAWNTFLPLFQVRKTAVQAMNHEPILTKQ